MGLGFRKEVLFSFLKAHWLFKKVNIWGSIVIFLTHIIHQKSSNFENHKIHLRACENLYSWALYLNFDLVDLGGTWGSNCSQVPSGWFLCRWSWVLHLKNLLRGQSQPLNVEIRCNLKHLIKLCWASWHYAPSFRGGVAGVWQYLCYPLLPVSPVMPQFSLEPVVWWGTCFQEGPAPHPVSVGWKALQRSGSQWGSSLRQ